MPSNSEAFDPELFLKAQSNTYRGIKDQLVAGRKDGHWMWFVFPQLRGLGNSFYADLYGLDNEDDAKAYLASPKLGSRLRECCELLLTHGTLAVSDIFSTPDDLKLHACLTLFDRISPDDVFDRVLKLFFAGERHRMTLDIIAERGRLRKRKILPRFVLAALVRHR